jgi:predicted amidohydrolase
MQRDLLERDEFFLLGTMDVRYLRVAPVAMAYRVAAKALGRDGRKFFGMSALVGEDGAAYAMAESTWIIAGVSRTAAFGRAAPTQRQ